MSPIRVAVPAREHDLALLAAGHETGWLDEEGHPTLWPEDFRLPDGTINPAWQPTRITSEEEPDPASNSHSF